MLSSSGAKSKYLIFICLPLYGYLHHSYAYFRHFCTCDLSKVHHSERSCRLFCLILESGMENCRFPKVAFKNTLAFQALPIFWSRTRGNGRSQANGSGWSKMLPHLNLIVSRPRLNKTFEICDLAMPAISGMNATPGKPGAPICLGNHATVYHFQRRFLEVKSCLFRPSVLYVFLCHLYGYLHHFSIPTPIEGEGGGQNQPVEFHFFLLGNPGIVIHPLEWNCKVTFINKPWARVWK